MTALAAFFILLAQNAVIQGAVVRAGSTETLSKAVVELRIDQDDGAVLSSMTTEDDGRFAFQNVRPGRYRLNVMRRGFARPPLSVTVVAGQPASGILLPLTPTGVITGRVYDAAGQPMGNIAVHAMKASYVEGRRTLALFQAVNTNDLGEYRLFWLPAGRYYVVALHPQAQNLLGGLSFQGGGTMMLGAGGGRGTFLSSATDVDPALQRFVENPDPRADQYMPVYFGGTTDQQLAAAIDLRGGAEFGGANIVITPVKARRVRGIIIDGATGKPVQYGSIGRPTDRMGPNSREIQVDPERATFETFLLPGVHSFTVNSANGSGYSIFKVGDSDIENLTIPVMPEFDVPGFINIEGTSETKAVFDALRINLRRDPPPIGDSPLTHSYSVPLEKGEFTLDGAFGDFRVNIRPILNTFPPIPTIPSTLEKVYVKSIRLGNTDVLNGVLRLERKPSAPLEIVLGTNPGHIEGQVVRETGGALSDITVVLVPNVRRRLDLYKTIVTDSSGRFQFPNIAPGDYKVFAWEQPESGIWFDAEFMREQENRGLPIRVTEGQTSTIRVPAP